MATYENKLKMQYLMRYLDSKRRAKAILDEIRNLEDLATKVTVTFNDMPGGGGADDQLGAIVSHIIDLKADMVTQAKTIKAEQQIVQAVIDAVDDPDSAAGFFIGSGFACGSAVRVMLSSGNSLISLVSPFVRRTKTVSLTMLRSVTGPDPSGVITSLPIFGIFFLVIS